LIVTPLRNKIPFRYSLAGTQGMQLVLVNNSTSVLFVADKFEMPVTILPSLLSHAKKVIAGKINKIYKKTFFILKTP